MLSNPATSEEILQPLVSVNQMTGHRGSIGFLVRVSADAPTALERTLQSILRQTEPGWEVLLSVAQGVQSDLDNWLDADWRIRRLPEATDGHEPLVAAAMHATSHLIGVVSQGDIVGDEMVDILSGASWKYPETELFYIGATPKAADDAEVYRSSIELFNLSSKLNYFFAVRKARILNCISMTGSRVGLSDELFREISKQAVIFLDNKSLYIRADQKQGLTTGSPDDA